jgi:uncharacterized protein (DUF2141 family)
MSSRGNFLFGTIAAILLSILISQCKSPLPAPKAQDVPQADTTKIVDTAKIVVVPIAHQPVLHTPLTMVIRNLASTTAPVIVGLYGTKNKFPDPKDQLKEYHFIPNGKELIAKITDIPFGVYALAIYQDVNSNGKIDKNVLGIPTEPYAFSNNYHPRVKAPGFGNCKFNYDSITNTVTMTMIK